MVATPGRCIDLFRAEDNDYFSLDSVHTLVVDEADRMLDMGFEDQVRDIISWCTHPERQTSMFTATWPKEVVGLANQYMRDPMQVSMGQGQLVADGCLRANKNVHQVVEILHEDKRLARLTEIMDSYNS